MEQVCQTNENDNMNTFEPLYKVLAKLKSFSNLQQGQVLDTRHDFVKAVPESYKYSIIRGLNGDSRMNDLRIIEENIYISKMCTDLILESTYLKKFDSAEYYSRMDLLSQTLQIWNGILPALEIFIKNYSVKDNDTSIKFEVGKLMQKIRKYINVLDKERDYVHTQNILNKHNL